MTFEWKSSISEEEYCSPEILKSGAGESKGNVAEEKETARTPDNDCSASHNVAVNSAYDAEVFDADNSIVA